MVITFTTKPLAPASKKNSASLSDHGPRLEKKKLLPQALPAKKTISFRSCSRPPRKKSSAVSGRQQNHHLFQNRVPAAEKNNLHFFIRSLQKSVCFPCIPMYFHIFSVKITGGPGPSLSELLPGWHEKKFCFFRNHHLFQNALLGRNKKNLPQIPSPKNTISFRSRFWREIKSSLVLCSSNPFYISFVKCVIDSNGRCDLDEVSTCRRVSTHIWLHWIGLFVFSSSRPCQQLV